MQERILVIDDESQITRVLRAALTAQGYQLRTANDPEEGLEIYREWTPDLVITDLMMPTMTGVDICRAIRLMGQTPILVLSVRDHERSKVEALDAGADDYVTKPFNIQELLARVRATSRRRMQAGSDIASVFEFGDVKIDLSLRTAHKGQALVHLTPIEYRLLTYLIANAGKVLTHRQILREVWGPAHSEDGHYVRVYMGHLRQKLEDDPAQPKHILTETAVGYRLVQTARV